MTLLRGGVSFFSVYPHDWMQYPAEGGTLVARKKRVASRRCARRGCTRSIPESARVSAKYCSPSCRTRACRLRKASVQVEEQSERNVNRTRSSVNLADADAQVDGTSGVNNTDVSPSLVTLPVAVLTDQLDRMRQALREVTTGQNSASDETAKLRLFVEQSVGGTLARQQELLASFGGRLTAAERERDRLQTELRTYFDEQQSRLRTEAELRRELDRLRLENQELRATLDAQKRQLAQPSVASKGALRPSERRPIQPPADEMAVRHLSASEVLSTIQSTLKRLLPAVPPDSTPIEQWPRESPTDRDHWKHWLVPLIWPALSDIAQELHPTSTDEAVRVRSELVPVTVVAAQLYLGMLLTRSRKSLPTVDILCELVLSSLRAMPLAYAPSYVERLSTHAGPLRLAAAVAIDAIHKQIQTLIAELTSHKA